MGLNCRPGHKYSSPLLGLESALARQDHGKLLQMSNNQVSFGLMAGMCNGVKIMICKLWKKTGEVEGINPSTRAKRVSSQ